MQESRLFFVLFAPKRGPIFMLLSHALYLVVDFLIVQMHFVPEKHFWAQMALASLAAISGPKKFRFSGPPFQWSL